MYLNFKKKNQYITKKDIKPPVIYIKGAKLKYQLTTKDYVIPFLHILFLLDTIKHVILGKGLFGKALVKYYILIIVYICNNYL